MVQSVLTEVSEGQDQARVDYDAIGDCAELVNPKVQLSDVVAFVDEVGSVVGRAHGHQSKEKRRRYDNDIPDLEYVQDIWQRYRM